MAKMSAKADDKKDKKAGIKENSARDKKLDAKRGVKETPKKKR